MGLAAVIGLTGMNVYSLYALHDSQVQSSVEKQKRQLMEYTNQVRSRFRYPVRSLWQLEMEKVRSSLHSPADVYTELIAIIDDAAGDTLFSDIYLSRPECEACDNPGAPLLRYDRQLGSFQQTREYDRLVSDGLDITRTRMNALVPEYRWNTRVIFDTQNSMTVALIDSRKREVVAYLLFLIDRNYLVNSYMGPKLAETFGTGDDTGIIVWLHDWTKNEVLATTHPDTTYTYQNVDFIQNFPDLLNDWNLKAAFTTNPEIAASRASLVRNLLVLAGAMILLVGTFIFMFFTAQRERALAQRQSLFLANVTHELKTPLSVILAAGENLSDGRVTDPGRLKSYGAHIYNESLRLRTMIDRLLDVARFDVRKVRIHKKETDVNSFLQEYIRKKKSYIESNQADVKTDVATDLPAINVDRSDLESILDNLLENAVKYSPDEKTIGIRAREQDGRVAIDVSDKGIGIPKADQKQIFDKFFRVEDALTARTRGHGLGLSIVKALATQNDGTVSVTSIPDEGSVFTVSFPVIASASKNGLPKNSTNEPQQQEPEHAP
ncbi:MAG: HAMP domain-containing sensor histidine kinase [Cyclonatronaceae bacterium]